MLSEEEKAALPPECVGRAAKRTRRPGCFAAAGRSERVARCLDCSLFWRPGCFALREWSRGRLRFEPRCFSRASRPAVVGAVRGSYYEEAKALALKAYKHRLDELEVRKRARRQKCLMNRR